MSKNNDLFNFNKNELPERLAAMDKKNQKCFKSLVDLKNKNQIVLKKLRFFIMEEAEMELSYIKQNIDESLNNCLELKSEIFKNLFRQANLDDEADDAHRLVYSGQENFPFGKQIAIEQYLELKDDVLRIKNLFQVFSAYFY